MQVFRNTAVKLAGAMALATCVLTAGVVDAAPATGHPRIWIRSEDVPRLRNWAATPGNLVYTNGLHKVATTYKGVMDSGELFTTDTGTPWAGANYDIASGAQLFAMMSLVDPDANARADWAQRSHTLVMYIIDRVLVPVPGLYFGDLAYSDSYRGNFNLDGIMTSVDWCYQTFSAGDKAKIRKVFLKWIGKNLTSTTSGMDHPEPVGVVNDPVLFSSTQRLRNALNNFGTSHMRNILFMATALDPADDQPSIAADPDNKLPQYSSLRDYVQNVTGAWLYMVDEAMTRYAAGGLPPEGFEYNSVASAHVAETLLALYTTGYADTALYGSHVVFEKNPFWAKVIPSFLHAVTPVPHVVPGNEWMGPVYDPANFGDMENYRVDEFMNLFGPIAIYDQYTNNPARLEAARWIEKNVMPGGAQRFEYRTSAYTYTRQCIWYFLMYDPAAATATDPRLALPLWNAAPGMGALSLRTSWNQNASWFTYMLPWNDIDHQHGVGNMVQWWRKGEWITKELAGYGYWASLSSYKNTLAIENTPDQSGLGFLQDPEQPAGSQVSYSSNGDPSPVAWSLRPTLAYASGDATNLYNTNPSAAGMKDVKEASRSVVWQPDYMVILDRAESASAGMFKQFWLNFATQPSVAGTRATVTTAGGQQVALDTLLPAGAQAVVDTSRPTGAGWDQTAAGEPMKFRVKVEAPGDPTKTRFLHVLQAADAGAPLLQPVAVTSSSGDLMQGASVNDTVILFTDNLRQLATTTTYSVPVNVTHHVIAGFGPSQKVSVTVGAGGAGRQVTITTADAGTLSSDASGLVLFTLVNGAPVQDAAPVQAFFTSEVLADIGKGLPDAGVVPAGGGNNGGGVVDPNGSGNGGNNNPAPVTTLSGLTVAGLYPSFSPDVTEYYVPTPAGGSITVVATVDPSLNLFISSQQVASGASVNAWAGNGTVDIVLYQGWTEVRRYTLHVVDPVSSLVVGGLATPFAKSTKAYSMTRPAGGASIPVTVTTGAPGVYSLFVQSQQVVSGATTSVWSGAASIDIVAYAGYAEVARYTVTLTDPVVVPPPPAPTPTPTPVASVSGQLASLTIAGLSPAFSPAVRAYTMPAPSGGSVAVTATLSDATETMYVNGTQVTSGKTYNAWAGNGKVDVVIYKNWNEKGRYTIKVQ